MHDQHRSTTINGLSSPASGSPRRTATRLPEFREALLDGRSGVQKYDIRYVGETLAGICDFDELKYQKKKEVRRGTRAGSIGIYCAQEAVADSGLDWANSIASGSACTSASPSTATSRPKTKSTRSRATTTTRQFWSHHHNPRTVANNPAGEITLNMGITGPHYTIGAACAAGNAGMIQGAQMLRLGECDVALAGGVSESIHTFGIFAGFASQGALAKHEDPTKASRPFDMDRNGIVVAEGGCLYVLERFDDARRRGAKIYGELVGYAMNSDASDFVLPNPGAAGRAAWSMALQRARLNAGRHRHRQHARHGHRQRRHPGMHRPAASVSATAPQPAVNNTKSFIGHAMGAAGALELAGNLPAFDDGVCHADDQRRSARPRMRAARAWRSTSPAMRQSVRYILNNSFGMLGINSVVIIGKV